MSASGIRKEEEERKEDGEAEDATHLELIRVLIELADEEIYETEDEIKECELQGFVYQRWSGRRDETHQDR